MLDNLKKKGILKGVGIVLVGGLVILFWWLGWFSAVFYILGLYGAVYIVSYLFKTTAIITFLFSMGGFFLYAISAVGGFYLLYLILQIMFTGRLFFGLLLLFLSGIFGWLFYFIPMAIGLVLGYPLIFMSEDIEKRFHTENNNYKKIE